MEIDMELTKELAVEFFNNSIEPQWHMDGGTFEFSYIGDRNDIAIVRREAFLGNSRGFWSGKLPGYAINIVYISDGVLARADLRCSLSNMFVDSAHIVAEQPSARDPRKNVLEINVKLKDFDECIFDRNISICVDG